MAYDLAAACLLWIGLRCIEVAGLTRWEWPHGLGCWFYSRGMMIRDRNEEWMQS